MSTTAKAITVTLLLSIADPSVAQTPTTPAPVPSAAPTPQPPAAQYPQQPGVQPQPAAQPQAYPQQPGVQPQPAAQPQAYPQQPGMQPQPAAQPQAYPQQPGAQPQPAAQPQAYPQQPGVQPQPAAQPFPQQSGMQLQREELPPPVDRGPQIKSFSFVPRLGMQLTGTVTPKAECTGSCTGFTSNSTDAGLSAAPAISFDFLFRVGNLVRLGPGLTYTHTMDVKPDSGASEEYGSLTTLDFVAELVPKVASHVWIIPRAQLGLVVYNASGAAEDAENSVSGSCQGQTTISGCDSLESPHAGFNLGGSLGIMFAASNTVRIRFDTLAEYLAYDYGKLTASSGGQSATVTGTMTGSRFLLLGGIEL